VPRALRSQTVRQIAALSIGGKRLRVVLSNEYGSKPLMIGAAHIAIAGSGSSIVDGSDRALSFDGKPSVTIPPGAPVISDPVDLTVAPLGSVAASVFLPEQTPLLEGYYNQDKEQKREAVNHWILSSGAFDGVIDFDAVTRDPNHPTHILAAFDSGDHLHPQDDGYKAMADSIDLKLLTAQP
jgi:hypothetical protein